jgi:membrane-associated protein
MSFLSPEHLVQSAGLIGIFAIIFAESGLLVGFFLPGDTLLISAGILASTQHTFSLPALLVVVVLAAIAGDSVGYTIGDKLGHKIFKKKDSLIFNQDHIDRSRLFYEKHGGKTIILARFVPVVRTFAPVLAGVGDMSYKKFLTYNVIGGTAWGIVMTFLGYFVGQKIAGIDKFIIPVVVLIMLGSIVPSVIEVLRRKKKLSAKLKPIETEVNQD